MAAEPIGDVRLPGVIMVGLLQEGWQLLRRHKKAVIYLYLANLFVASLLLFPFMQVFEDSLGPGLYREKLVGELDYDWYGLFQDRVTGFASTFAPWVLGGGPFARNLELLLDGELTQLPWAIISLGVLYILLNSFLLAAAVGSFALEPQGTGIRQFFRNGGLFFGRFFRLAVLAVLAFWFVASWMVEPLGDLVEYLTNQALTDRVAFYWNLARYLIVLGIFLFLNMLFDYAKIQTAVENRTSVLLAFISAVRFCVRYFFAAFGFYLLITALGLAWVILYTSLEGLLPQQSWGTILLAIIGQQLYLMGRLMVKLLFYSGQMQFYLGKEMKYGMKYVEYGDRL
ncbi:MAG: hypothetical protein O6826_12585 [Acidobacteria bacterium]|nr:hypothetical protein [Acidobacteriota bacterium]